MDAENEQGNDLPAIIFRSMGLATQIGGTVAVAVLGSLFLGLWIDRELGSSPWATLLLLGLGTLVAVMGCYRVVAPMVAHLAASGLIMEGVPALPRFRRSGGTGGHCPAVGRSLPGPVGGRLVGHSPLGDFDPDGRRICSRIGGRMALVFHVPETNDER